METLEIRKKSTKTWLHIPSNQSQFIIGKFTFSIDGDDFQIVELGQAKRNKYNYANITVIDDTTSTTYDNFTSIVELSQTLESLSYIGFLADGESFGVISVNGLNGVVVIDGDNITVTDPTTSTDAPLNDALQNIFDSGGGPGTTPTLPQVLAQGDRQVRFSDGDGDTFLELADREKFLYNNDADFLHLPAELFPDGSVLKINNPAEIDLFGITGSEYGTIIQINGIVIDEFAGITLRAGTAILKKISGEPYSDEFWTLSYEVAEFSREALGLNLVDNTPDNSKPVSTAQATAIATAQSAAQTYAKNYTDNIRLKQPARIAVDVNVTSLSGQQTFQDIIVSTGDVILLMAQTNRKENGLWLVNGLGAWTRPEDFRNGLDVSFVIIPVLGGAYRGRFFGTGAGRIVGDATGIGNITIQEIRYYLNGISFSDGSDITEDDYILQALGKLQKQLTDVRAAKQDKTTLFKNTTQTIVTGTTGEVIIYAEEVLANTISNNTILSFRSRNYRSPRAGTCIYKIYINTVNNLTGSPVQIARLDVSVTQGSNPFERDYLIKDNTLNGFQFNAAGITNVIAGNVSQGTTTYNINTTYYWILTAQPNTSSDSLTHSFSILERI